MFRSEITHLIKGSPAFNLVVECSNLLKKIDKYKGVPNSFPLLNKNNSRNIYRLEIQFIYFWKAETCSYLAHLDKINFKIEFPCKGRGTTHETRNQV